MHIQDYQPQHSQQIRTHDAGRKTNPNRNSQENISLRTTYSKIFQLFHVLKHKNMIQSKFD